MLLRILLVASDAGEAERIRRCIRPETALVRQAEPAGMASELTREPADLVLLRQADVEPSGRLLRAIRDAPEQPEVVVIAEREEAEERAGLLASGCLAVIHEALPDALFAETLEALFERRRAQAPRPEPAVVPFRLGDYASASAVMKRFLDLAHRVASGDSTLLLLGETGVGKEWLARAIHAEGPRRRAPFVAVACAALSETLLESDLFGHERGAFTGASRARRGYFELAHTGTIFLDEIGEVPLHLQSKLLRVLEERRIRPLGSERSVAVDVRVVAATNRDLDREVRAGRFREDLFYRLNVLALELPPLRERREDIPELVESYLAHFSQRLRRRVEGVEPEAMQALVQHAWPGNVRELINTIERAVLIGEGARIHLCDLPDPIGRPRSAAAPEERGAPEDGILPADWLQRPWRQLRRDLVERAERRYLSELLRACQGRLWEVAERAGLDPRSLFEKMQRHGLRKEEFRASPRAVRLRRTGAPSPPPPADAG